MRHQGLTVLAWSAALALGSMGCDDTAEPSPLEAASPAPAMFASAPGQTPGSTDPAADPSAPTPAAATPAPDTRQLVFEADAGSDGSACVDACFVELEVGAKVTLAVVYAEPDGTPVAQGLVAFEADAPAGVAHLTSTSAYTDDDGRASVVLTPTGTPADDTPFAVTASVPSDPAATPLTFVVHALPAAAPAPLEVTVEHVGADPAASFDVFMFRSDGGGPSCDDVHPDAEGAAWTPELVAGPLALGATLALELPGLQADTVQSWTVLALGPSSAAPTVAGCVEVADVRLGDTASVDVVVDDLPRTFVGSFDITTRLDLVTGLPGQVDDTVQLVVELFNAPGEPIIAAACKNPSGALATVCPLLISSSGPTIAGAIVVDAANAGWRVLLTKALGEEPVETGAAIEDLLEGVALGAAIELTAEAEGPAPASFPAGTVRARWETASYTWTFGLECDPADPDTCEQFELPLADILGASPEADLAAHVEAGGLAIAEHAVPTLTYGALVDHLIEREVLPRLTPAAEQGLPPIDSYEDLIGTLLGDDLCLLYDDCCDIFADRLASDLPFFVAALAPAACELAIDAGADALRDQVLGLGGPLSLATPTDAPCATLAEGSGRAVTNLGAPWDQCVWDARFDFADGPFTPDNSWTGARQ